MDRKQHIEFLTALLQELDDSALNEVHVGIAHNIPNLNYVIIYDKLEEKWQRAEAIEKHVKEAVERIRMREDWKE